MSGEEETRNPARLPQPHQIKSSTNNNLTPTSLNSRRRAGSPTRPRPNLTRLSTIAVPLIEPAERTPNNARVGNSSRVAVVDVDAGHDLAAADLHVGEGALARVLRAAVAARPVQLADVARQEVLDRHRAAAVVLQHLVLGAARPAAVDVGGARGLLEGRCVFADVGPPAVLLGFVVS